MSDRYFVDTNILMYAHDAAAGVKHDRARKLVETLWRERSGALSTQILQELCVNLGRKVRRPLATKSMAEIVRDYLTWHVVVNDETAILAALELVEEYRISFWDALVIHAAQMAGAEILYSEDLSDGQFYGSVRVVNPLTDDGASTTQRAR